MLTSYDLTSTCCSTRALNHVPDLSVGFASTISPLLKGGGGAFLGTDVAVLSLQLLSLQELSLNIFNYFGFEELTGHRNQCPSAATKYSLSWRTLVYFSTLIELGRCLLQLPWISVADS